LYGRYQTQPNDDLYYTVLERMNVVGILVGALRNEFIKNSALNFASTRPSFQKTLSADPVVGPVFRTNSSEFVASLSKEMSELMREEKKKREEKEKFHKLIQGKKYEEAIQLVVHSHKGCLRTPEVFQIFKGLGNEQAALYFRTIMPIAPLNAYESMEFVKLSVNLSNSQSNLPFVAAAIQAHRLTVTQEMGDYLRSFHCQLALVIYLEVAVPDKIIDCLKEMKEYPNLIEYARIMHYDVNYVEMLKELNKESYLEALKLAIALTEARTPTPIVPIDQICQAIGIQLREGQWNFSELLKEELQKHTASLERRRRQRGQGQE